MCTETPGCRATLSLGNHLTDDSQKCAGLSLRASPSDRCRALCSQDELSSSQVWCVLAHLTVKTKTSERCAKEAFNSNLAPQRMSRCTRACLSQAKATNPPLRARAHATLFPSSELPNHRHVPPCLTGTSVDDGRDPRQAINTEGRLCIQCVRTCNAITFIRTAWPRGRWISLFCIYLIKM